jgi:NAD(P)-dependent dehydrogenase (short-subunit alcohol dehydrogenase family)
VLCHCESVDAGILDTTVAGFDRHYAVNVRVSSQLIAAFARQLIGRLGTPEDAANLIRFLSSDDGSWINGQMLHSNGGVPRR